MSTVKTEAADEAFTAKLDIHMVSTSTYRKLIDSMAGNRLVLAVMGPSGIGKSAIPRQVAAERDVPYVALHMPTMSIEDFHVPTKADDTKHYYDRRIPRKFQPLFEYVEAEKRRHPNGKIPAKRCPILAIEELNRAVDKHVTRATFTLLDDRVIGDMTLPDEVQMVVSMNPSGGGMSVNEFEKDPAMRRRLVLIGVSASYGDFMRFAKDKFHAKVIEHLEAQPLLLYDTEGAKSGKVFACPATWDNVSRLCTAFDEVKMPLTSSEARAAFAGAIGGAATEVFVEFVQDATVVITPEEVLGGYHKKSTVQERFLKLRDGGRQDKVTALASNVAMQMFVDTKRNPETFATQLSNFMEDLPEENTIVFIRELAAQAQATANGREYMRELNRFIAQMPAYNKAMARMQTAQKKGDAEAKA
jgi:hypothetical protein